MLLRSLKSTHSLLCSSLEGLDLQLQFVHQVLQTAQVLTVLLSLDHDERETESCSILFLNLCTLIKDILQITATTAVYLVGELLDASLIFTDSFH